MRGRNKIISIFMVLAMALCGFFATAKMTIAQADNTINLTIEAKNVSYSDSLYIVYAVSAEGFDIETCAVKMLFWDETQSGYELGSQKYQASARKQTVSLNGKDCLVFYSNGIAAKNMTDDIYARAYVEIDGTAYYSAVQKFSVLEYAHLMLERDIDDDETNNLSIEQKNLINALLRYGAAAQKLFEYNTDRLANAKYYKMQVENGLISDGFTSGRFQEGESVVITAKAPAEDERFLYWLDSYDNVVSDQMTYEVVMPSEDMKFTAVYEVVDNNDYILQVVNGMLDNGQTSGTYKSGERITITANAPAEGMQFSHWQDADGNVASTESVYEVTIAHADATYTAVYKKMTTQWENADNVFPFPLDWAGIQTTSSASTYSSLIRTNSRAITLSQTQSEVSLTIEAKNVSYSDSLHIVYAVSAEGFDTATCAVKMLFWNKVQDSYELGTESYQVSAQKDKVSVNGKSCLAFYSKGIAAKNMTDDIYARVCVEIDGTAYYSAVQKFSVLEYAHLMLERNSDGDDSNDLTQAQTELMDALLEYGAAAQALFKYNTDRLANDTYYRVQVENGLMSDGFTSGRYLSGETVIITANEPAEGYRFSHWQDANGNIISKQSVYEYTVAQENIKFSPIYREKTVIGDISLSTNEIAYGQNANQILPSTISFDYDGEIVELAVVWSVDGFNSQVIGEQTLYATLVDSSAYGEYGVGEISMVVNVLPYSVELNSSQTYTFTGYYGEQTTFAIPSSYKGVDIIAIGDRAFENNSRLTNVEIPNTIINIGDYAFYGCTALTSITVAQNNQNYKDLDGNLYTKDGATLIQYLPTKTETSLIISEQITSISAGAFAYCTSLTSVIIPENVVNVGANAFYGCANLQEINCMADSKPQGWSANWNAECPSNVVWGYHEHNQVIDQAVAPTCTKTGLTEGAHCSICGQVSIEQKVIDALGHNYKVASSNNNGTHIEVCDNDSEHTITVNCEYDYISNQDGTKEGYCECGHCDYTIDENVLIVENNVLVGLTDYGKTLTKLVILGNIDEIRVGAFDGCNNLQEIVVASDNATYMAIDGNLYSADATTLIQYAVAKPQNTFEIPEQVTSIGAGAFAYCTSLTSMLIPESVVNVGANAFYGCANLQEINCMADSKPQGWSADWNAGCPSNVVWGYYEGTAGLKYYLINDGAGYAVGEYAGTSAEVVIPATYKGKPVIKILESAFNGNTVITSIEIPSSVKVVGAGAFNGTTSLTKVNFIGTIDEWAEIEFANTYSSPTRMAKGLYINNEFVTEIKLTTATKISARAFYQCESVTSIEIPNTVTSIGEYAFRFCKSITSIVVPDSVTEIGQSAFAECSLLQTVVLPNGIERLESRLIYSCPQLISVEIPSSVTYIADLFLYNSKLITTLYIPDSVQTMQAAAIRGCTTLKIYCEADSAPSGWASNWNYSNRPVIYGYKALINQTISAIDAIGKVTPHSAELIAEARTAYDTLEIDIAKNLVTNYSVLVEAEQEFELISQEYTAWKEQVDAIVLTGKITVTNIERINFVESIYNGWVNSSDDRLNNLAMVVANGGSTYGYDKYLGLIEDRDTFVSYLSDLAQNMALVSTDLDEISLAPITFNNTVRALKDKFDALDSSIKSTYFVNSGAQYKSAYNNYATALDLYNNVYTTGIEFNLINNTAYEVADYNGTATEIIIPSVYMNLPVTSIGEYAFDGNTAIITVVIPNSVTNIGYAAFNNCSNLQTVTLGNGIETISDYAFFECKKLRDITLPSTVTSIGEYAFYNCRSLTSIIIPEATTHIGYRAFTYCMSLTIYCELVSQPSEWNSDWNSTNCPIVWNCRNNNMDADENIYTMQNGIKYAIKGGVATVTQQPQDLTDVIIPSSITYGGRSYAVKNIEARAFYSSALKTVVIPESVTSIGDYAFYNCDSLVSITIPSSVKAIGKYAFSQCDNLISASLPTNVESIGSYAFRGCGRLSYTEENGFKYLGNNSNPYIYLAEITDNTITTANVNNGCRIVGSYVFSDADSLTSVTIPASVVYMGHEVFYKCYALTISCQRASQPAGFEADWNYAMNPVVWNCNTNKVADDGYIYTVIGGVRYALSNDTGKAIVVRQPQNLTSANILERVSYLGGTYIVNKIDNFAFYNCSALTSVSLPDTLEYVGAYVFEGCNLTYNKDGKLYYLGNSSNPYLYLATTDAVTINNPTINANCKFIGDSAFVNAKTFNQITIPASIKNIGANAFASRSVLRTVIFEEGSQLQTIGNSAFYGCTQLTSIVIPDTVEIIGQSAFATCVKLSSITLPENLISIEAVIFEGCTALTSIHIPEKVQYIDFYAFNGCTALKSVTFDEENEMTYIEDCAFLGCSSLLEIAIPDSVTYMGIKVFKGCKALAYVTLSSNLTDIKKYTFYDCSSLLEIVIPSGLKTIGISAFEGCLALRTVEFEANSQVASIQDRAFYGCKALRTVIIPKSVLTLGQYAFSYCSVLNSVTFETGTQLTTIGYEAFSYSGLTSLIIPKSVTTVSYGIVAECSISKIYCEASSKPAGWHNNWHWLGSKYASVSWGYNA